MFLALTILKVVIVLAGLIFLIKGVRDAKTNQKLWFAIKTIFLIFVLLLIIGFIEWVALNPYDMAGHNPSHQKR